MTETTVKNENLTKTGTNQADATTASGAPTYSSSLNANVDLFFEIGASRGRNVDQITSLFQKAIDEEPEVAIRILLWSRDVRGGAGERQIFRDLMTYALNYLSGNTQRVETFLEKVVEVGRWDDLISLFFDTKFEKDALVLIRKGLLEDFNEGNQLLSKVQKMTDKECDELVETLGI